MTMVSASVIQTKAVSITDTAQTLVQLGFTQAEVDAADIAMITVESACRFTIGGAVAVSATVGHYLTAQIDREFPGRAIIGGLKLIRIGGSNIVGFVTLARM